MIRQLEKEVSYALSLYYYSMAKKYVGLKVSNYIKDPSVAFHAFSLNLRKKQQQDLVGDRAGAVDEHIDRWDAKFGFCCLVVLETFTGGNLVFPELELEIVLYRGDVVFFHSSLLKHFNSEVVRDRNSMVFFNDESLFTNR